MNRDVCEHFTPAGIPCVKCQTSPRLEKAMGDTPYDDLHADDTSVSENPLVGRLERQLASLRAEKEQLATCGVVELSVLTNNVSLRDYMLHWEQRAERAEAERDAARYESRRNRAMFDAAIQQLVKIQSFVKGKDVVLPDGRSFSFHPPIELVREAWTALTEAIESTAPNIDAAITARKGEQ